MKPELSIIIVSWNSKDYLRGCLKSIYKNAVNVSFEVIVVDNVSTDKSQKMIKQKFSKVRLITNKENVGFGSACNQAAMESRGEYLLILNPDTEIIGVPFKDLFNLFAKDPTIGAIIPIVFDAFGNLKYKTIRTIPTPLMTFGYIYPQFGLSGARRIDSVNLNKVQEHQYPPGFCFLIKSSTFNVLSGFDEHFFLYFEDTDLGVRLRKIGLKVISYPGFKIVHVGARSTYKNISVRDFSWHESSLYFFKKNRGIKGHIAMKTLLICGAILDIVLFLINYLKKGNVKKSRQTTISYRLKILWWHLSNFSYEKLLF